MKRLITIPGIAVAPSAPGRARAAAIHHVTAVEDSPVLSREHGSFELKPHNFFDRNPALDLRRAPFEVAE